MADQLALERATSPADLHRVLDLAQAVAAELAAAAVDPAADLTQAERCGLVTIAAAVQREVTRWAGLEPRSAEAQAIIDRALAVVLPNDAGGSPCP